jgi:hypothetical protein
MQTTENLFSARPQTEFLCKPIRRIMEDEGMTRSHGGGIIGRGIIEKESLRRETSERYLGGISEAPGSSQRLQEARGLQEAPSHKNRCLSQLECKSFMTLCTFTINC